MYHKIHLAFWCALNDYKIMLSIFKGKQNDKSLIWEFATHILKSAFPLPEVISDTWTQMQLIYSSKPDAPLFKILSFQHSISVTKT